MICDKERFEIHISLRDVIAVGVLIADVVHQGMPTDLNERFAQCVDCYAFADSMLEARNEE